MQCNAAPESASEHHSLSRRAAIGGGLALAAAAANLQAALPAAARQVVSSDWEKVDLPVDPGVVLLDIGFTDDKHGANSISPPQADCAVLQCEPKMCILPEVYPSWLPRLLCRKCCNPALMTSD